MQIHTSIAIKTTTSKVAMNQKNCDVTMDTEAELDFIASLPG